jgi:hypothetical protein
MRNAAVNVIVPGDVLQRSAEPLRVLVGAVEVVGCFI